MKKCMRMGEGVWICGGWDREAEGRSVGPRVRLKVEVQGGTVRLKGGVQVQV